MLEELAAELKKYRTEEVAYKTGLSSPTISKIVNGKNTNPTLDTLTALQNFLEGKNNELS